MAEYYPKKAPMPQDIYNKTIWHIRGYDRMKQEARDLISRSNAPDGQPRGGGTGDPTSEAAERREHLQRMIATIEDSLLDIPEEYRAVILDNVARKIPLSHIPEADYASTGTWSKHRITFITGVAIRAGYMEGAWRQV